MTSDSGAAYDAELIDAIEEWWAEHGYGPAFDDIRGARSKSIARAHCHRLRKLGLVTFEERITRTLRLTDSYKALRESLDKCPPS